MYPSKWGSRFSVFIIYSLICGKLESLVMKFLPYFIVSVSDINHSPFAMAAPNDLQIAEPN